MALPESSNRPRITASWEGDTGGVAFVKLTAHDLQANERIAIRAVVNSGSAEVYASSVGADINGEVDQTVRIPVSAKTADLCITAKTTKLAVKEDLVCPLFDDTTVWVRLTSPAHG